MGAKDIARGYFDRIGSGHRNAVSRPDIRIPGNDIIDRRLREMVEGANNNGDCIISAGMGYYRPVPGDHTDEAELREYIAKDLSRAEEMRKKVECMRTTFENWRREAYGGSKRDREKIT